MNPIQRELNLLRELSGCRGDDNRIDEAERELARLLEVGARWVALDEMHTDAPPIAMPSARDVGRLHDMSLYGGMRVGFDSDNDVFVTVWQGDRQASIEFCTFSGGGHSQKTREALIALMVAMEADNKETPTWDFWARRNGRKP